MSQLFDNVLSEIPLQQPDVEGHVPKNRLQKASNLRDIFMQFRNADRINSYNRSLCQALLDGEPPFNESELADMDVTNINFQGAEGRLEKAKAPYYRLILGSETLLSVKTYFGPEDERPYWENVLAEEISKMIRRWDQFPYQIDLLVHKHVWEGVGVGYWPDDRDWRPRAGGLGQFFFPRQTAATEFDQGIICVYEEYTVPRLYSMIEDREAAKANGWDVDAVLLALQKASSGRSTWWDWEQIESEIKNNDIYVGSRMPKVKIIHGYVEEFDGTVSHYITTEDATATEAFLFKGENEFKSMSEVMVLFPYASGTNTKLHSIRGLGYKIYPMEQQRNRSIGRLIDKGMEASSTMVQPDTESDLANIGLEYIGNLAVLAPGLKLINSTLPDLERSVMPSLTTMDQILNERTSGYTSDGAFQGDQRKTKFEIAAHLEQSASLSDSSLDFFYAPWRRVLQQIVRRITDKSYRIKDPGGKEVAALKKRLERRGVPVEALYGIDHEETMEIRVIGAGSAAAKTLSLDRMAQLYPRMDDVGKANFDYDMAVDTVGVSNAGRYFSPEQGYRTTVDTQIAILQNYELLENKDVPVLSTDKHLAHAREHLKPLAEMYQAVESNQMDIAQAATTHALLYSHTEQHVNAVAGDEASVAEANQMRQLLQRIGEVIANGMKEAQARQEKAQAEAQQAQQEQQGQQGEEMPFEVQQKFAKAQAEIEVLREKGAAQREEMMQTAQVKRQIAAEDAASKRAIADTHAAADILRKNKTQTAEEQTPDTTPEET